MRNRLPSDAHTVIAHFNYNALAYDMASMLADFATRAHVIRDSGVDECERLEALANKTMDVGAELFSNDPVAVYGNPTTVWKDD